MSNIADKLAQELIGNLPAYHIDLAELTKAGIPSDHARNITIRASRFHPVYGKCTLLLTVSKELIKHVWMTQLLEFIHTSLDACYNDSVMRMDKKLS